MNDTRQHVISEIDAAKDFVRENWNDKLGAQLVGWLEKTVSELSSIERRDEIISLKKQRISLICSKMWEEDPDPPKVLTLRKKY